MLRPLIGAFAAFLIAGCAAEAEETQLPAPEPALELTGRVVDAADVFSAQFEDDLTRRLGALEQETQVQFVVASTPDLEGENIADYARKLGNDWGLGSVERDDGLLLLVAPNDRQVRIAVGIGLETTVKDEEAALIIDQDILPHFRDGDYEVGVSEGVDSLVREVAAGPSTMKDTA